MELRPSLQIRSVIKALQDVILPAVDPANKLAIEQGHLAINQLTILLQCLPLMYRYDRDELSRFLELGTNLRHEVAGMAGSEHVLEALEEAMLTGTDILKKAGAEPQDLEAANFLLREKIGAIITAIYAENETPALKNVAAAVMSHASEQLLRERALLINQGWEPDPKSIPPIESLIAGQAAGA